MALKFFDGFGRYVGSFSNNNPVYIQRQGTTYSAYAAFAANGWSCLAGYTSQFPEAAIVPGPWTNSKALRISSWANASNYMGVQHGFDQNYATIVVGSRQSFANVTSGPLGVICLQDGSTNQLNLVLNSAGKLELRRGGPAGTLLATAASALSANTYYMIELKATIHNTAGAYEVRVNGSAVIGPTSSANTRNSANNYTTGFFFGADSASYGNLGYQSITDVYYDDSSFQGDQRCDGFFCNSDSAVAFSFGAGVIGEWNQGTYNTVAPGANQVVLRKYVSPSTGSLASVGILPQATSATAKFKALYYPDSGGAPSGAATVGSEVVGCTSGTRLTLAFGSPPSLTAGTTYWIGYMTDTSIAIAQSSDDTLGYKASNTYGSGAPSGPTMTAGQASYTIWGNLTGVSANLYNAIQARLTACDDQSYIFSSTLNHENLFGGPGLTSNPSTITSLQVCTYGKKTDAGARALDCRAKSGATTGSGGTTGIAMSASYAWMVSQFATNPDTSAAWTVSGVNGATYGQKITT